MSKGQNIKPSNDKTKKKNIPRSII